MSRDPYDQSKDLAEIISELETLCADYPGIDHTTGEHTTWNLVADLVIEEHPTIILALRAAMPKVEAFAVERTEKIQKVALALFKADHCGTELDWKKQLEVLDNYRKGLSPEWGEAPHYLDLAEAAVDALA